MTSPPHTPSATQKFEQDCMETWGMTADEVVLARIVYSNRDELQRIHKGKTNKLNRLNLSNRKLLREIGIIRTRGPERVIINIERLNYYLALPCNQFIHPTPANITESLQEKQ
jgi:hypothetical protein